MIMKATLSNKGHPEYGVVSIPFPIPRSEYDHTIEMLKAMDLGGALAQDCRVDEISSRYSILNRLVLQSVNVDELDYLAKRLESFCKDEGTQFQAMASKLCLSDIRDFINLTFCCQEATVITDFSDLERIGKTHSLTINGGTMIKDEFDKVDGQAVALDLLQSGAGVVTPYGIVYDNSMKLEQLYDGQHFPEYLYENSLLVLELSSHSVPYEDARPSWLYFPMPDGQIQRAMIRAGVSGPEDIRLKLVENELPQHVSEIIDIRHDGLNDLNALCRTIAQLDHAEVEKLEAVVLMVQPSKANEVLRLAEKLDQFYFVPSEESPEQNSQLNELGYVAYHGKQTLEALMKDDPTEQHQQDLQMGGLTQ